MRLCDRCFKVGDYRKSVDNIVFQGSQEQFDLCESCSQTLREYCIGIRRVGPVAEEAKKEVS